MIVETTSVYSCAYRCSCTMTHSWVNRAKETRNSLFVQCATEEMQDVVCRSGPLAARSLVPHVPAAKSPCTTIDPADRVSLVRYSCNDCIIKKRGFGLAGTGMLKPMIRQLQHLLRARSRSRRHIPTHARTKSL